MPLKSPWDRSQSTLSSEGQDSCRFLGIGQSWPKISKNTKNLTHITRLLDRQDREKYLCLGAKKPKTGLIDPEGDLPVLALPVIGGVGAYAAGGSRSDIIRGAFAGGFAGFFWWIRGDWCPGGTINAAYPIAEIGGNPTVSILFSHAESSSIFPLLSSFRSHSKFIESCIGTPV